MGRHGTGVDSEGERCRVEVAGPLKTVAKVIPAAVVDLGLVEGTAV